MFAKVSAISFGIIFFSVTHSVNACTISPPKNQPKLENILATDLAVFIGTVVDSGGPTTKVMVGSPPREVTRRLWPEKGMAKIKVEIPIRGEVEVGKIFEVRNGGGGDCSMGFEVGQRWFFSGNHFVNGSTMLVDEFGDVRLGDVFGVAHEEIVKMFPELLKLPSPSIVVQDYLKEK